jgi:hypothetical protein
VAADVPAAVGQQIPGRHPLRDQLGGEPGEEFLQGLLAARQQRVGVAAVRHATPVHRRLGQLVPVDHDHLRVRVGEGPRGHQPGHACAQYDCAVSDLPAHRSHLLARWRLRGERCAVRVRASSVVGHMTGVPPITPAVG